MADRVPLVLGTDANGQIIFEELPAGDSICAPICGLYAGQDGAQGPQGPIGPQGEPGPPGSGGSVPGNSGGGYSFIKISGLSLFVSYVQFDGTVNSPEDLGKVVGDDGDDGNPGSPGSGYSRARIQTNDLFIDFIKADGTTTSENLGTVVGAPGSAGSGFTRARIDSDNLFIDFINPDGTTTSNNLGTVVGSNGAAGSAGSGYTRARIETNNLFIDFIKPDGTTTSNDLGTVVGSNGAAGSAGSGYTRARIDSNNLFIDFIKADGTTTSNDLGTVVGTQGDQGAAGSAGSGYTRARIETNNLFIDFIKPDGTTTSNNLGTVVGSDGQGYTRALISGITLYVDSIDSAGATTQQELGKVVGDDGGQGPVGAQGGQGPAGPGSVIESSEDGGWSLSYNPEGKYSLSGRKPVGGNVLKFIRESNGGSGGLEWRNDLAQGSQVGEATAVELNFADGATDQNGNFITGSEAGGASPVSLILISGATLAATGSGHIAADQVKKSDGSVTDITALPVSYFGGAVEGAGGADVDIATNWQKLSATFRGLNAGSIKANTFLTAGDALTVNGAAEMKQYLSVGGSASITGTATAKANLNVSGDLGAAQDANIEGNINLDGSAVITKYPRMFAIGTSTASIANTDVDLTWNDSTAAALTISDGTGTITIDDTNNEEIQFHCDGDYQVDVTCRSNANNRIELFIFLYIDLNDGTGWRQVTAQQASNYAARDADQNTGGTQLTTLLSMTAGQKVKFVAHADSDGTAVLLTNGTFARIIKLPTP